MGRFSPLVQELGDVLRAKNVDTLVYFHTDHFEPWRSVDSTPAVGPEIVDAVHDFCRATDRIDFARRLTLFYKPHLNYVLRRGEGIARAHPDDLVGFTPRTAHEERCGAAAMGEVAASTAHDIQLHIHHEYYTATTCHTKPESVAWFSTELGRSLDAGRVELAIKLNWDIIEQETRRRPGRWFFVHGHWALNGSDDTSCTVNNEIEILLRNGCRGDFTFPAGRAHTNPRIKVPYLCRPFDKAKGYDFPEAEPEIALGNSGAADSKFFIWASAANSVHCSLDYLSPATRRQIEDTAKAARDLVNNAYVAAGRIYIKTHAHSMHPYYSEHTRSPVFPHQYPPTQVLLSVIFEAAAAAGIDVRFLSVPEVYDGIVQAREKPDVDLALSYLGQSNLWRDRRAQPSAPRESETAKKDVLRPRLKPGQTVEMVREGVASVLQKRIDTLGVHGSGAYQHYSAMLQNGFNIPAYDLLAFEMLRSQAPRASAYHEIGSGIGALPFLLALNGYPAVGIEVDQRRHETAMAIWRELSARPETANASCRLVLGRFPEPIDQEDTSDAIAIVTDFITSQTDKQREAILAGLRRYRYALIDLQRFVRAHAQTEDQMALLKELCALGFTSVGAVPDQADCAFVLLRNDAIVPTVTRQRSFFRRLIGRQASA